MTEAAQTVPASPAPAPSPLAQAAVAASHSPRQAESNGNGGAAPVTNASARPDWLPESYWDGDKSSARADDLKSVFEAKTAMDARRALVPADAKGYELKLPDTVKLPDGFKLDETDPRLAGLREFAHKNGWTPAEFSEVVALDIKRAEAVQAKTSEFVKAEVAKLGQNAGQQVDTVLKWLGAQAENPEHAKYLASKVQTADDVRMFTKIMKSASSGGVDALNSGGREQADTSKIEGYATMTMKQKLAAADAMKATGR